jgi:hypothetical protein
MDTFLDEMLLIYPVLDVRSFEKITVTRSIESRERLYLQGAGGAQGEGNETPDGFVVLAGAVARATLTPSMHQYMRTLRDKLIAEGLLQQLPDSSHEGGVLTLKGDYLFGSPSTAAAVLLGRNANGRVEWKDAEGRTLKEIQTAAVQE